MGIPLLDEQLSFMLLKLEARKLPVSIIEGAIKES